MSFNSSSIGSGIHFRHRFAGGGALLVATVMAVVLYTYRASRASRRNASPIKSAGPGVVSKANPLSASSKKGVDSRSPGKPGLVRQHSKTKDFLVVRPAADGTFGGANPLMVAAARAAKSGGGATSPSPVSQADSKTGPGAGGFRVSSNPLQLAAASKKQSQPRDHSLSAAEEGKSPGPRTPGSPGSPGFGAKTKTPRMEISPTKVGAVGGLAISQALSRSGAVPGSPSPSPSGSARTGPTRMTAAPRSAVAGLQGFNKHAAARSATPSASASARNKDAKDKEKEASAVTEKAKAEELPTPVIASPTASAAADSPGATATKRTQAVVARKLVRKSQIGGGGSEDDEEDEEVRSPGPSPRKHAAAGGAGGVPSAPGGAGDEEAAVGAEGSGGGGAKPAARLDKVLKRGASRKVLQQGGADAVSSVPHICTEPSPLV
jgi:hypothetical protein